MADSEGTRVPAGWGDYGGDVPRDRAGQPYPSRLPDAHAIATYVATLASDPVDAALIEDLFGGGCAVLRWLPLPALREGHPDGNLRDPAKEARYAGLPRRTMPPLLVEDGRVWDGNHRLRVEQARGTAGVWCYDIRYED